MLQPSHPLREKGDAYYSYLAHRFESLSNVCKIKTKDKRKHKIKKKKIEENVVSDYSSKTVIQSSNYNNKEKYIYKIDWSNPLASYYLNKAILQEEFQLKWWLPNYEKSINSKKNTCDKYYLVPSVIRSINYLCWIKDLLILKGLDKKDEVLGCDVGTGASCIFPLLGCKLFSDWNFIGIDINADAIDHANCLIKSNFLKNRVKCICSTEGFFDGCDLSKLSFSVCNPPFFSSEKKTTGSKKRSRHPTTEFSGTATEKCLKGLGEVGFFEKMFRASAPHRNCWFTSMFGHKKSLLSALNFIEQQNDNVELYTTSLVQGKKRRWALAWQFQTKKSDSIKRQLTLIHGPMKQPSISFEVSNEISRQEIQFRIEKSCIEITNRKYNGFCTALFPRVIIRESSDFLQHYIYISIEEKKDQIKKYVTLTQLLILDNKTEFYYLASCIKQDVLRCNRKWRRLSKIV